MFCENLPLLPQFGLQVKKFQKKCMWAIRKGYDGKEFGVSAQWTFTGAFLYSLTVITTIGL